jgi:hypothetical protein
LVSALGERALVPARRDDSAFALDNAALVTFTSRGHVDYVVVSPHSPHRFTFEGLDVFSCSAERVVAHLHRYDRPDLDLCSPPSDYTFPKLILTLSEACFSSPSERLEKYEAVGIGSMAYLESIRAIRHGRALFDKWREIDPRRRNRGTFARLGATILSAFSSAATDPVAPNSRNTVDELASLGATVAVDDEGQVRRIEFVEDQLARPVSNADLSRLQQLNRLEALSLSGNKGINDNSMKAVEAITSLRALRLRNTSVGPGGLLFLKELHKLEYIRIGDAGIDVISDITSLQSVECAVDRNTERELRHLQKLPRLSRLVIEGELSDKGLTLLHGISSLRVLSLIMANVAEEHVLAFRQAMPDVRVFC